MKKILIILIILALGATTIFAQEQTNPSTQNTQQTSTAENEKTISFAGYFTAGGPTIVWNMGLEMLIMRHIGLNIALSYFSLDDVSVFFLPLYASLYLGTNYRLYFDIGAVLCKGFGDGVGSSGSYGYAGLGFNYNPKNGGFFFKIGPALLFASGERFIWFGISAGYSF